MGYLPRLLVGAQLFAASGVAAQWTPLQMVTHIRVEDELRCSAYDSDDYTYPQSVEAEIVASMGGNIYGPYTGDYFGSTRETQIEHIVARAEAHDSGACAWDESRRRTFARDLDNLTLADPVTNRGKSSQDFTDWRPAFNECWFAARIVAVKRKWDLTADGDEIDHLASVLATCTSTEMDFDVSTPGVQGPPRPSR